jgi:hypothetical protein
MRFSKCVKLISHVGCFLRVNTLPVEALTFYSELELMFLCNIDTVEAVEKPEKLSLAFPRVPHPPPASPPPPPCPLHVRLRAPPGEIANYKDSY